MTDTGLGHARYEEWDAAYVLGALSPAERREYEEHLAGCESCQAALGELAGLPGLLSRLPAADAFALLDEPASTEIAAAASAPLDGVDDPDTSWRVDSPPLTASLAHAVSRRRRRARGWTVAALALAAAVAVGAVVVPAALGGHSASQRPDVTVALADPASGPLSATVELSSRDWGTAIDMSCRYRAGDVDYGAGRYGLYVTDAQGTSTLVSTWWAKPGDDLKLSASTDVPESSIRGVELRDVDTGAVLLQSKL